MSDAQHEIPVITSIVDCDKVSLAFHRLVNLTIFPSHERDIHEQLELDLTLSTNLTIANLAMANYLPSRSTGKTQRWTGSNIATSRTASPFIDPAVPVESALGLPVMASSVSKESIPSCHCHSGSTTMMSQPTSPNNSSLSAKGRLSPSARASTAVFLGHAPLNGQPSDVQLVLVAFCSVAMLAAT